MIKQHGKREDAQQRFQCEGCHDEGDPFQRKRGEKAREEKNERVSGEDDLAKKKEDNDEGKSEFWNGWQLVGGNDMKDIFLAFLCEQRSGVHSNTVHKVEKKKDTNEDDFGATQQQVCEEEPQQLCHQSDCKNYVQDFTDLGFNFQGVAQCL